MGKRFGTLRFTQVFEAWLKPATANGEGQLVAVKTCKEDCSAKVDLVTFLGEGFFSRPLSCSFFVSCVVFESQDRGLLSILHSPVYPSLSAAVAFSFHAFVMKKRHYC